MKKPFILVLAIFLLLALLAWMLRDLFMTPPEVQKNPYEYGMKNVRKTDSIPAYSEIAPLKTVLHEITSLACGQDGKIYIAGKGGVEIVDPSGRMLKLFSIPGLATCMTLLPGGNLAIGMEDHVEIWTPSGNLISSWETVDTASVITSIAASQTLIFVADAGKKIVYRYDRDGKFQGRIGEKDPVRKIPGFIIPSPFFDVGISPDGDLWIANTGRYRLEKYSPDGSLLSSWGEASMALEGFAGCCNPTHFTFLKDGSFATSEKGIERVKVYSPTGKFKALVAGPDAFDEGTRGLDLAAGVDGRILVLDPSRNQVRIFLPKEKR
jgi:hypothetical protein